MVADLLKGHRHDYYAFEFRQTGNKRNAIELVKVTDKYDVYI